MQHMCAIAHNGRILRVKRDPEAYCDSPADQRGRADKESMQLVEVNGYKYHCK